MGLAISVDERRQAGAVIPNVLALVDEFRNGERKPRGPLGEALDAVGRASLLKLPLGAVVRIEEELAQGKLDAELLELALTVIEFERSGQGDTDECAAAYDLFLNCAARQGRSVCR